MQKKNALILLIVFIGGGLALWLLFGFFGVQALFTNTVVDEVVPVVTTSTVDVLTGPRLVTSGNFQQGDTTYSIQGKVIVTEDQNIRTLSLSDFSVSNGPDLFVYAVRANGTDNQSVKDAVRAGRFVNLSALKGNRGNQSYTLPSELDLNDEVVISIWCRRFARNFGFAELQ